MKDKTDNILWHLIADYCRFICIAFILLFVLDSTTYAAEKKYQIYKTQSTDTVETIAKQFFPNHQKDYGNHIEEYISDLKHWNPHVTNWKSIPDMTPIYISFPYPPYPAPPLSLGKSENTDEYTEIDMEEKHPDYIQTELPKVYEAPGTYKIYTSMTLSEGTFSEKLSSGAPGIQSQQNSPLTLGIGGNYLVHNNNEKIYSFSTYISFLKMSQVTGDTGQGSGTINVPSEIGANFYNQNFLHGMDISFYEGIDYEKFSTFNTIPYTQQTANLGLNTNTMILGTIGIANSIPFNDKIISLKFSASTTLSSSSSGGGESKYSGQRLLFFASVHGSDKFSYNFLYKRHMLKGPTDLTIERIGLGLSYDLF